MVNNEQARRQRTSPYGCLILADGLMDDVLEALDDAYMNEASELRPGDLVQCHQLIETAKRAYRACFEILERAAQDA